MHPFASSTSTHIPFSSSMSLEKNSDHTWNEAIMTCCKNHLQPTGWLQTDSSSYCFKFKISKWCVIFLVRFWCGSLWPHNLWFQYNYNIYLKFGQRKDRKITTNFHWVRRKMENSIKWPLVGQEEQGPWPGSNVSTLVNLADLVCALEGLLCPVFPWPQEL